MYRKPQAPATISATVPDTQFIIDFDSTLTRVEALDELAHISLKHHPERSRLIAGDRSHHGAGDGRDRLPFDVALDKRIALLHAHRTHLSRLIRVLAQKISASIRRNRQFFVEYHDQIFVVSGGFKDFIVPDRRHAWDRPGSRLRQHLRLRQEGIHRRVRQEQPALEARRQGRAAEVTAPQRGRLRDRGWLHRLSAAGSRPGQSFLRIHGECRTGQRNQERRPCGAEPRRGPVREQAAGGRVVPEEPDQGLVAGEHPRERGPQVQGRGLPGGSARQEPLALGIAREGGRRARPRHPFEDRGSPGRTSRPPGA